MSDLTAPHHEPPQRMNPLPGSSCQRTATRATSSRPAQNAGMAMPSWARPEINVPLSRRWPVAARNPSGIATTRASSTEKPTNGSVTDRRLVIWSAIDTFDTNVLPRSPVTTPPAQSK